MKAVIKKVKQAGSCSYCEKGVLGLDGKGLDYPYKEVIEISGRYVVSRLCLECARKITNIVSEIGGRIMARRPIERRIAYYTRKVAELGAHRPHKPVPPWYKRRHARLMAYKKRMHEIIEQERGK